MSWRIGMVALLLTWLVLPSPGAAAVQRFTDGQGVIHISNIAPARPQPRQEAPAAASEPEAALNLSQLAAPAPGGDGSGAPALQKVSYEAAAAEAVIPAALLARSQPATLVTVGGIRCSQDGSGIWRVTNQAPEGRESVPALLEARQGDGSAGEATNSEPGRIEALAAPLPLKQVAWTPETPDLLTLPTTPAAARASAPAGPATGIRHYRDHQGVIHISNAATEAPAAAPPVGLQARAASPATPESDGPLAWKPAAWSPDEGLPLKKVKAEVQAKSGGPTEGGIRRWRDKKGVWHIETPEYPWPAEVPLPERLAGLVPGVPTARAAPSQPSVATPPGVAAPPGPAAGALQASPTSSAAAGTRVTAFRDRNGRLKITNEPPALALNPRPPGAGAIAPAELEPLIAEAAQVHRLPASLIRAVIKTESDFCSWAVSPKGAMGLMQLMPGTASSLGVAEPFNPRQNILGGCRYLRTLIDFFGGSVPLALAGYNAGFQRVVNCGFQVPPIKETQNFVTVVLERYGTEEKKKGLPWT